MAAVSGSKPHVVCIPFPAQSHIKAMLKLARLLHHKGFFVTFVNTEYNQKRLVRAGGLSNSLDGLPNFNFQTIPDGLPPSDADSTQDVPSLCQSLLDNGLTFFLNLLTNTTIFSNMPPITAIISDAAMPFTVDASRRLEIPVALFYTISACAFMDTYHIKALKERGLTLLKDESYLTNEYLDTVIDWIPGMKGIRLRDLPTMVLTTDPNDVLFNFCFECCKRAPKAAANVFHTFDDLEQNILKALSTMLPGVHAIAPIQLHLNQIPQEEDKLKTVGCSLWKEESECLSWLDSKEARSVVYVNFGSITVMSQQQLVEFAWGLAGSGHQFLWIIRPDLVMGESAVLPKEFVAETKERGLTAGWCPQEEVLNHPSIGGFLTHCGWNSILESLCAGVPMLCWPLFGDQPTNCRYLCTEWEVGMEIDNEVKRDEVEKLVRELMDGEQGKKMKNKALEWKKLAEKAANPGGSSTLSLDNLINKVLLPIAK